MSVQTFEKVLTATDTGETGAHQVGFHIPKTQTEFLTFLPPLDASVKNPDAWLQVTDTERHVWQFRYIYYNNKHHDRGGTRDEYRITHVTQYFRSVGAEAGDTIALIGEPGSGRYSISLRKNVLEPVPMNDEPVRVTLRGWRRVH
jgi:hypothetical protein